MLRWAFIVAFGVTLAGCQSSQEIAAQDDETCKSYGLQFGTSDYAQCREMQQADRTRRYEADKQYWAAQSMANAVRNSANH